MYQQHSPAYYTKEQRFNDKFPLSIVAVLGVIQMLTTFAIFALEIGHNVIHLRLTNLFVGFWTSVPFTILWISMFAVVCCCRRRSCATHAVIQNMIAFIFAGILIGINIAFIRRPNECFFSKGFCENLSQINTLSISFECVFDNRSDTCGNTRLVLIKTQLAAGVIMAVTCLLYLIIYSAVAVRANRRQTPTAANAVMTPVYQQPLPSTLNYQQQPYTIPAHPYQPSAPVRMVDYPPQMVPDGNYLPPNQYPAMYPKISNDRF